MYRIIADSGCELFELEGTDFRTAPLTISTSERSFLDDETLDTTEMIEYLAAWKGRSYTSCPSADEWLKKYGEDADEIYVVTLTSGLSGTYNSACVAKEMYLEEYPQAKVHVVDSLSVGPEMMLLLEKLAELKAEGKNFEETVAAIEEYKKHTRLFFSFISLHNLVQNGRVSKLAAAAAAVMNISIVGTASPEGTIDPLHKSRGEKRVLKDLSTEIAQAGYNGGKFFISQVRNTALAQKVADMITAQYPQAQIKIVPCRGLVSYYAEDRGIVIGLETV